MACSKKEQKHIAVIGAGASGLVVMKELNEVGVKATCFELLPVIGGVYAKSYDNTMLTTSSLLTSFSSYSDGNERRPKFWTDEEYLQYLNGFADKYDIKKNIKFRTKVEKIDKCSETGKWVIEYRGGQYVPPHRTYNNGEPMEADPNAPIETMMFDGIACATGTNNWPSLPAFKGEECFKGEIIHSEYYRHPEHYKGKRVMIVGAGESGSDICNEISKHAEKVAIVCRGKHGHLIPRAQSNGRVTDLNTNRCRYSNPYIFGDAIGWTNQQAKKWYTKLSGAQNDDTDVLMKIAEYNVQQGTSAFSKFGCKNAGFVEAVVRRGAELHRTNFELKEDRAVFDDGTAFECDAIVACTGYKNSFPFIENFDKELAECAKNPRTNYKQIFPPQYGAEFAFFGFARPAFGSIPPTSEMQARYYAMVVSGEKNLPSESDMIKIAKEDTIKWESRFKWDSARVKGLVDFQLYNDDLAGLIGCLPNLGEIWRTEKWLWSKLMFGPFTSTQYRLKGPRATPDYARDVIGRYPHGDVLETAVTASFLVTAKALSTIGFKQFTPNNF